MTGATNAIADIAGLRIGQAHDAALASGVSVVLFDDPATVGVSVLGGASAGRDLAALAPDSTVEGVNALVLSGGSGYGLDAASGVQAFLREKGIGFRLGAALIPIVPQAICFDLLNGGDKDWGRYPPYRELAYEAASRAGATLPALGSAGAGYGATTVDLKGGTGSASARLASGHTVAALAVVNAVGSTVIEGGPHFWAGGYEIGNEFGGLGWPATSPGGRHRLHWKGGPQPGTTIAIIATDAALTKAQATRVAIAANDGLARALDLTHAPFDGDTIFAAATGKRPLGDPVQDLTEIGAMAANVLARAIARGIYEATALPFPGALPAWRDKFPGGR
ncbi:MAG: P1 family peptidase [Salinarimonas sp.]|nr:P1 family peptidase [Salinarimonas sp.]